ncbi:MULTISPECIES: glutamate-1-semialdehyde 2,1-aminomutase [Rhodomicrobium]|uniref:glutamate-1-semialdehyde 2,1-aminomutase n=1 Tax=Rhodomicrobium TaxID=1068 RepID=UPI000B4BE051|nr:MULTISPECIES: glutamate-1-semialdehyde 2,1-aminomutase [Rhodomicrobium]
MNLHSPRFPISSRLQQKAHALIPGGSHTYAKGDDQYPILAPGFIARGQGCHVWDADGNEYIEYGMGNRAVGLGHGFAPVVAAVTAELAHGCNFTRPSPIEVECAESLLGLIGGAEMVKFCKNGSDATSAAVKLARAYTGRDLVAYCGDHPFFSVDDWFIGPTPMGAGVPDAINKLSVTFRYNDIESVKALIADYPGQISCFMLEAARTDDPKDNFLHEVKRLANEAGALFVLDEMITGFRWHKNGAQKLYDIEPDLSTFGKALGNGFSVSALAGKREFMRLGGLDHYDRPRVFLLSTTHGAETHALAAAIATIKVYQEEPVIERMHAAGDRLRKGFAEVIARRGLGDYVSVMGRSSCLLYGTKDKAGQPSQAYRSLFLQEVIRRGVIMPSLATSYSHSDADVDRTVAAIDGALDIYARALEDGTERYLVGRPSQMVQRRFNVPDAE